MLGGRYAVVSCLVSGGDDAEVRAAAEVLLGRIPVEFSVLLVWDLLTTHPTFMLDEPYLAHILTRLPLVDRTRFG